MIEFDINGKSYGTEKILGEIKFSIEPHSTLALLGPSGIGKSTFLRIASGLDTDFEGTITNISKISMVFQEPTLVPWRTALQKHCLDNGGRCIYRPG